MATARAQNSFRLPAVRLGSNIFSGGQGRRNKQPEFCRQRQPARREVRQLHCQLRASPHQNLEEAEVQVTVELSAC